MSVCGKCGKQGHNSRTCGQEKAAAPEAKPKVAKVRRARSAGTKRAPKPIALEVLIADMRRDLDALEAAAEVLRRRTK